MFGTKAYYRIWPLTVPRLWFILESYKALCWRAIIVITWFESFFFMFVPPFQQIHEMPLTTSYFPVASTSGWYVFRCQWYNFVFLTSPRCIGTKWAPSSEFVSSSIPSWQILTAHAQPFRGARDLAFCLKVPLDSLLVWASSEGSGETARMRRLAWTFAARIGYKYQIRLTQSKYLLTLNIRMFSRLITLLMTRNFWGNIWIPILFMGL